MSYAVRWYAENVPVRILCVTIPYDVRHTTRLHAIYIPAYIARRILYGVHLPAYIVRRTPTGEHCTAHTYRRTLYGVHLPANIVRRIGSGCPLMYFLLLSLVVELYSTVCASPPSSAYVLVIKVDPPLTLRFQLFLLRKAVFGETGSRDRSYLLQRRTET